MGIRDVEFAGTLLALLGHGWGVMLGVHRGGGPDDGRAYPHTRIGGGEYCTPYDVTLCT